MKDFLNGYIAALIGACAMGGLWAAAEATDKRPMPALIAHDCEGAGGDLWAMDESDFPTDCRSIERY